MFNWFKKSKSKSGKGILLEDLEGNPLQPGDIVNALRYDLGPSRIIEENGEWFYVSEEKGEKVSYVRMIDAATKRQKVLKQS
jgi:hypothetical protein